MIQALGAALLTVVPASEALARGFGVARGGGVAVVPRGGVASGSYHAGAVSGPFGGAAGGVQTRSYTGPRGTTVQAGRAGGVSRGPLGGIHAGGVEGARVTTPGGRTFTTGSAGHVGVGPAGGVRAGGVHGAVATGPFGGVAAGRVGGVAVAPGGVRLAGGGVAVGHGTRYLSPGVVRTQATWVRGGYYHGAFTTGWYGVHVNAWRPVRWVGPAIWVVPAWPAVSVYCGISGPPIVYDYGSNVVIEDDYVYVDGSQVASAQQYAEQATQFADAGRDATPAKEDEWQSLGVFGMVQGDEKTAQQIFQLAVNKDGVVRGNYYDAVADNTLPIYGSVDKKTQRVAWSIGEKKTTVFETGLQNLTEEQTTLLVHYGTERTQQMVLVRLEEPKKGGDKQSSP
jgi:hypothetical protein